MFTPRDGDHQNDTTRPISFTGVTKAAGGVVRIRARGADGNMMPLTEFRASDVPVLADDGSRYYPYRDSLTLPSSYWASVPGCPTKEAFVAANEVSPPSELESLHLDVAYESCIEVERELGAGAEAAASTCGFSEPVRISSGAAAQHAGNLLIRSQADANALRCVEHVRGNVTVEIVDGAITLPNLRTVTGNLVVSAKRLADGTGGGGVNTTVPQLPVLLSVGGDLTLRLQTGPSPSGSAIPTTNFGLPKLAALAYPLHRGV